VEALEPRTRCSPAPGVRATVSSAGELELLSERDAHRYRCGPAGTAIWIALRRNDDDVDAAADMLAKMWGTDRGVTRSRVHEWIGELHRIGLLEVVIGPAPGDSPGMPSRG
jgi:hypothetical protein